MSETVITWNVENLVTITLMGIIGFTILRVAVTLLGAYGGASNA